MAAMLASFSKVSRGKIRIVAPTYIVRQCIRNFLYLLDFFLCAFNTFFFYIYKLIFAQVGNNPSGSGKKYSKSEFS